MLKEYSKKILLFNNIGLNVIVIELLYFFCFNDREHPMCRCMLGYLIPSDSPPTPLVFGISGHHIMRLKALLKVYMLTNRSSLIRTYWYRKL